jgi:hypothetical protein
MLPLRASSDVFIDSMVVTVLLPERGCQDMPHQEYEVVVDNRGVIATRRPKMARHAASAQNLLGSVRRTARSPGR